MTYLAEVRAVEETSPASVVENTSSADLDKACGAPLPTTAAHQRERKLHNSKGSHNSSARIMGQRISRTVRHIPAAKMIEDHFPNEHLAIDPTSKRSVLCRACKKPYPLIRSSLVAHCLSSKHKQAKEKMIESTTNDSFVRRLLEDYFQAHPLAEGASLPADIQVFRFRVVESLLGNGIAMAKANNLRTLLERSGLALSSSSHLSCLIPPVLERELALLENWLCSKKS